VKPTPLQVRSYTHFLYKVQDLFHTCRQSKGQNKFLLFYNLKDQHLLHRSRNSGRQFVGCNQLFCRSVLTPVSCTKLKIHSTHADSPRAETNFFSSKIWKTSLCFTDQETQEENLLGGANSFAGQFLHPSLVQSSRSIPRMQTVQGPKQISSLLQFGRLVFVSQI